MAYKVRRNLTDQDGKEKSAVVGQVSFVGNLQAWCRARGGVAYVRDLTRGGGGYGVELATGAQFELVGAVGLRWVGVDELHLTLTRAEEVAAIVGGASAEAVAALRRVRRQATVAAWRPARDRAAQALEQARQELESAEALTAEALLSENLSDEADPDEVQARLATAQELAATARKRYDGQRGGQAYSTHTRLLEAEEKQRQAEEREARRQGLLARRAQGRLGRAANALEALAEDAEAEQVYLEEVG